MSNLLFDTKGVCLVTDESHLTESIFFNKIDMAVEAGIDILQVRSKSATNIQFYELAHKIRILFPSIKLIINNNIEVALAVNAEAIQLGESSMSPEAVRFKIENRLHIGKSVHSLNSAINAEKSGVDYLIVGTIFLAVCLFRCMKGHSNSEHHFGFEAAAWYWHFVDVVWLFLFAAIYIWGS